MTRLAALVAVALLATLGGACKPKAAPAAEDQAPPVEVHCVAVEREAIDETASLRGRIQPPPGGDLPVASQVPGRIVSVAVKEGQKIVAGDLVATIDEGPSRDALRQAEAALTQARAAQINADATLERTRAVVARGIAPKQELDDAVAKQEAAHAGVLAAQAGVDLAQRTLGRVYVRSSFEGVVTRIWRGAGAIVDGTAATPLIELAASNGIEFLADATEAELEGVREGQPAKGTLASGGDGFEGVVRARGAALDPATGLGTVRIAVGATDRSIPIGSFGRVVVTTAHREGVLVVPSAAIRGSVADGAEVAMCKDGKAALRTIKVGWRDDERVEALEGLDEGDRVAVDHVLGLEDDTPIVEAK